MDPSKIEAFIGQWQQFVDTNETFSKTGRASLTKQVDCLTKLTQLHAIFEARQDESPEMKQAATEGKKMLQSVEAKVMKNLTELQAKLNKVMQDHLPPEGPPPEPRDFSFKKKTW